MQGPPVGPGIGRAGDPARIVDDHGPAVAVRALVRPAGRDQPARHETATHPGRGRPPAAGRPRAWSAARSRRPRGTRPARGRCRRSGRARRGSARPCRRSCSRRRRRRSPRRRARTRGARRSRPRVLDEAARTARASPSATSDAIVSMSIVTSGTAGAAMSSRTAATAASRSSPRIARRSTSSRASSATTFGRVPAWMTPTLQVTPGQRPVSAWSFGMRSAAARIALRPFSGSTPAWAARPWTDDTGVDDALARADDVAVGPGALEHERRVHAAGELADDRGRGRRADLLVRVGHEPEPLERQLAGRARERPERVQAGEQAALHVA